MNSSDTFLLVSLCVGSLDVFWLGTLFVTDAKAVSCIDSCVIPRFPHYVTRENRESYQDARWASIIARKQDD